MSSPQRARNTGGVADDRRSKRLRARYRERATKLRARAMAMISSDTRQVMLGIADYLQRMADRLETSTRGARGLNPPSAEAE